MQLKTNSVLVWGGGITLVAMLAIWGWLALQPVDPQLPKHRVSDSVGVGRSFRDGYRAGQALAGYRSEASLRPLSGEEVAAKAMSAGTGRFSRAEERDAFEQGFQTGYRAGRKERSAAR